MANNKTVQLSVRLRKLRAGANGKDSVVYRLQPSVDVVRRNPSGAFQPVNVTCAVVKTVGNNTTILTTAGQFKEEGISVGVFLGNDSQATPNAMWPSSSTDNSVPKAVTANGYQRWALRNSSGVIDTKTLQYIADGTPGDNGYNTAIVYLYKRNATRPNIEDFGDLTYTFATQTLNNTPNNWSQTPPISDSNVQCWVTAATACSREEFDVIAENEWSTPVRFDGKSGEDAKSYATASVFLYRRTASKPSVPNAAVDYYFDPDRFDDLIFGHFEDPYGALGDWSLDIPSGTAQCWVTHATAFGEADDYDTIEPSEWSEPAKFVKDGGKGDEGQSAYNWTVTPDTIVLKTKSNGSIDYSKSRSAVIKAKYKGNDATVTLNSISTTAYSGLVANTTSSITNTGNGTTALTLYLNEVNSNNPAAGVVKIEDTKTFTKSDGSTRTMYIPATSGYFTANVTFSYSGVESFTTDIAIPFSVDLSAHMSEIFANDEEIRLRVTSAENASATAASNASSALAAAANAASAAGAAGARADSAYSKATTNEATLTLHGNSIQGLVTKTDGLGQDFSRIEQKYNEISLKVGNGKGDNRTNLIPWSWRNLVFHYKDAGERSVSLVANRTYMYVVKGRISSALKNAGGVLQSYISDSADVQSKDVEINSLGYDVKYLYFKPAATGKYLIKHSVFPDAVIAADRYAHVLWDKLEDVTDNLPGNFYADGITESDRMNMLQSILSGWTLCETDAVVNPPLYTDWQTTHNLDREEVTLPNGETANAYVGRMSAIPTTASSLDSNYEGKVGDVKLSSSSNKYHIWTGTEWDGGHNLNDVYIDILKCRSSYMFKKGETYTYSFWAKAVQADSRGVVCYLGGTSDYVRSCDDVFGKAETPSSPLTDEWQKYSVSITPYTNITATYFFPARFYADYNNRREVKVYVARPKLELGGRATYGAPDTLLDTGIDINKGIIRATANKFEIQNNNGEQTFSIDENGNIVGNGNASFKGAVTSLGDNNSEATLRDGMALFRRGNGYVRVGVDADNNPIIYGTTINADGSETTLWMLGSNGQGTPELLKGSIGSITPSVGYTTQAGNTAFECEAQVSNFTIRNVSTSAFSPNNTLKLEIVMPNGSAYNYIPDAIGNLGFSASRTVYVNQDYSCVIPYSTTRGSKWLTLAEGGTIYGYAYLKYNGEVLAERTISFRK